MNLKQRIEALSRGVKKQLTNYDVKIEDGSAVFEEKINIEKLALLIAEIIYKLESEKQ